VGAGNRPFLTTPARAFAALVRAHHERMDGAGYPDGLTGEAIPLGARIVAVADAYDALTTNRSYRQAHPGADALHEIQRNAGPQFDARVVGALAQLLALAPQLPVTDVA
jgi:two-component system cell cycle response regulator